MDKVVIIGSSGSGKTTLAFNLAARINAPAIDLDDIYWKENWTRSDDDEFRIATGEAISGKDSWVVAGNYTQVRDVLWTRADTLIWLDYSLARTFNQLARRSFARILDKQEICNGNTETLKKTLSSDGVLYWMLRTYHAKRQENLEIFAHPERLPNIHNFVRLRSPAETQAFLNGPAIAPR
jgi:adenylate kinase family enzyme